MKDDILSIGDAIRYYMSVNGLLDEADMRKVIADWENMMGKAVALHTRNIWYRDNVLFLEMSTPVWKNELMLAKRKIMEHINQHIGREVLKEVRIT